MAYQFGHHKEPHQMPTKPRVSQLNAYRRPSGGLGGVLNGVELDWEPGDPRIAYDARLRPYWTAIQRHMAKPRPPVTTIIQRTPIS